ncbi:hypothetical protein [Baekduia alba]|uniref:hypothetical protein n=1 Tax=Baekduia alba TaxID=2997333 RepID=UPI00234101AD|nr:hypothetical protein [Baekduia alba]
MVLLEADNRVWRVATPPGVWALTPEGVAAHAEPSERRRASTLTDVRAGYEVFLALNQDVKQLTSEWQAAGARHLDLIEELAEIHEQAAEGFAIAARDVPRFAIYAQRLDAARAHARAGVRSAGISVLPAFIVSTELCRRYSRDRALPREAWEEIVDGVGALGEVVGRSFGGADAPPPRGRAACAARSRRRAHRSHHPRRGPPVDLWTLRASAWKTPTWKPTAPSSPRPSNRS